MDPNTAFTIAASVISLLEVSFNAVSTCREIYKEGSTSSVSLALEQAKSMADIKANLEHTLTSHAAMSRSTNSSNIATLGKLEEKELRDLGQRCTETAGKVVAKLEKLTPQRKGERGASKATLRGMWDSDDIRKLQEQLEGHRGVLDSKILISLRFV